MLKQMSTTSKVTFLRQEEGFDPTDVCRVDISWQVYGGVSSLGNVCVVGFWLR